MMLRLLAVWGLAFAWAMAGAACAQETDVGDRPAEAAAQPPAGEAPGVAESAPEPAEQAQGQDGTETEPPEDAEEPEDTAATPADAAPDAVGAEAPPSNGREGDADAVLEDSETPVPEQTPSRDPMDPSPPPRQPDRLERTLERLAAEAAQPATATGPQREPLEEVLLREARLGVASSSTELAEAELRLRNLRQEADQLKRVTARFPGRVARGEVSLPEATDEVTRLAREQARYDALYDDLADGRRAARARADEYQELAERVSDQLGSRLAEPTVRSALAKVQERADIAAELADVLRQSVSLAAANAESAAEAIGAIQQVISTAPQRRLLYRSEQRPYRADLGAAWQTLRDLAPAAFGRPPQPSYALPYWVPRLLALGAIAALVDVLLGWLAHRLVRRRHATHRGEGRPELYEELLGLLARRSLVVLAVWGVANLLGVQGEPTRALTLAAALWLGVLSLRDLMQRHAIPVDSRDADLRRRTRRWLVAVGSVVAAGLPLVLALRWVDYPHGSVIALVEALGGSALAIMVAVWLWRPGSLTALDGWSLPHWERIRRHAPTIRFVLVTACLAMATAHWLGWMNLASYAATGVALSALIMLLAATVDESIREGAGIGQRPSPTPRRPLVSGLLTACWILAVVAVAWAWGLRVHHVDRALDWLASPVLSVQGVRVSVFSLLRGLAVAAVIITVGRLLRGWIERLSFGGRVSEGSRFAAATLTYYLLIAAGLLGGVLAAGLGLSVLTVFAGVAGVAIGFGSQDIARNFISGLIILLDRSINVGDYVSIGGTEGTIVEINIRCTTLRTPDNRRVIVPNSNLVAQQMVSAPQLDRRVRLTLELQVAPEANADEVTEVLSLAARAHSGALPTPEPEVWMSKLSAEALVFQLQFWTDRVEAQEEVRNQLLTAIWRELKARGIGLA
jgi:small-conductance mechanosensitive channel/NTP pyrophosphatase (non-canonical NTP hydrolase)